MSSLSFCQGITGPGNLLRCLDTHEGYQCCGVHNGGLHLAHVHPAEATGEEQLLLIASDNECIARTSPSAEPGAPCLVRTERSASSRGAKTVRPGGQRLPTQRGHRSRTASAQVFLVGTRKPPVPLPDHRHDATCNSGSNPAAHIQESRTQIHWQAAGSFNIRVLFAPHLSSCQRATGFDELQFCCTWMFVTNLDCECFSSQQSLPRTQLSVLHHFFFWSGFTKLTTSVLS